MPNSTGVLLMAFGGPDSPEAIAPFMKNLMGGKTPPPPLVEKVKARYQLIGGSSPLPVITAAQAKALEDALQGRGGGDYQVAVGMRYWHPFIQEGVEKLLSSNPDVIVGVSLAPFFSRVSTGAYLEELQRVMGLAAEGRPQLIMADSLFDKPRFLQAAAERVEAALRDIPSDQVNNTAVIFSAHSLPVTYDGDPYADQFKFVVNRLAAQLGIAKWQIGYQSKGGGQGEWLTPMVEDLMDNLPKEGINNVLVVPIGFVSDHIETLYDVDIAQKEHAHALGLNFYRSGSLNTSPLFIDALADLVLEALGKRQ